MYVFGMDMNLMQIQGSFLVQDINEVKYFGVNQQGHCDCPSLKYIVGSGQVCYFKTYLGNNGSIYMGGYSCWNMTIYTSKEATKYSKGTTKYSDVTSTSSTSYPNNKESGSYWYIYKGLQ